MVADVSGTLPFGNEAVIEMRAVDILEHISWRWTHSTLREWARVITHGGTLYVQVPDAGTIMRWYATDDARLTHWDQGRCSHLEGATWRLLGGHADGKYADVDTWQFNAHFALFSEESLRFALDKAGFDVLDLIVNGHPNLCASCRRR